MGLDQRGCIVQLSPEANWRQEEPRDEARPLDVCASGLNIGSRVKREFHARFWERPGVKFPRATRQQRDWVCHGMGYERVPVIPVPIGSWARPANVAHDPTRTSSAHSNCTGLPPTTEVVLGDAAFGLGGRRGGRGSAKGGLIQFVAADAPSIHLSGSRRYGPLTPYGRLDVTRMGPGS